ncbi:hypothetical protein Bca4012_059508 [Brassica carinata]|uniref:Uncharacterized protein n=1 Tax=Brassica carinata TaxID=52824 RepID=A0A8X7S7N7_BRACI|nr:hypothetical protein Bca52824_029963 [Brassica carinata]
MPGNHGEITVAEQNRVDNDNKKTRRKDVNQTGTNDDSENRNQLVVPSVSKPRKQFKDRFSKKHKSRSGSCKGGCFSVMRPRRTEEEEEDEGSPSSSSALDHGMLRVMLENNDFFSDECNPHR